MTWRDDMKGWQEGWQEGMARRMTRRYDKKDDSPIRHMLAGCKPTLKSQWSEVLWWWQFTITPQRHVFHTWSKLFDINIFYCCKTMGLDTSNELTCNMSSPYDIEVSLEQNCSNINSLTLWPLQTSMVLFHIKAWTIPF